MAVEKVRKGSNWFCKKNKIMNIDGNKKFRMYNRIIIREAGWACSAQPGEDDTMP
jgi:hypothetical protein